MDQALAVFLIAFFCFVFSFSFFLLFKDTFQQSFLPNQTRNFA